MNVCVTSAFSDKDNACPHRLCYSGHLACDFAPTLLYLEVWTEQDPEHLNRIFRPNSYDVIERHRVASPGAEKQANWFVRVNICSCHRIVYSDYFFHIRKLLFIGLDDEAVILIRSSFSIPEIKRDPPPLVPPTFEVMAQQSIHKYVDTEGTPDQRNARSWATL